MQTNQNPADAAAAEAARRAEFGYETDDQAALDEAAAVLSPAGFVLVDADRDGAWFALDGADAPDADGRPADLDAALRVLLAAGWVVLDGDPADGRAWLRSPHGGDVEAGEDEDDPGRVWVGFPG